jgi:S-DNA-T family DNA segregation ATPase FtsK/SpoIIIE
VPDPAGEALKLKVTLRRPNAPEADIVVIADGAATLGELAAAIAAGDPFANAAHPPASTLRLGSATAPTLDSSLTLADSPLASGAYIHLASASTVISTHQPLAVSGAFLLVIAGPDAGQEFALKLGSAYLGRQAGLEVSVTDPLVSKHHARLDVFRDSVRIVDLNSANGIEVDGEPVTRVELTNGGRATLGDTVVEVRIQRSSTAAGAREEGWVPFNRSPRVESRYPGTEHLAPSIPTEKDSQAFPWVALFAPLLLGIVFAFMGRGLQSLLFVAASPILMLGTFITTRATRKRKEKLDAERFSQRTAALDLRLASERDIERNIRLRETPSTAEAVDAANCLSPLLWTRRPEHWQFLTLNLGIGTMPSRNKITLSNEESALPDFLEKIVAVRDRYRDIGGVPVTESLPFSGAFGIAGGHAVVAPVARALIAQLTALHSPAELAVAAMVGPAWVPEFEWLKWLPHVGSPQSPIGLAPHLATRHPTGIALLAALEELVLQRGAQLVTRGAAVAAKAALDPGAAVDEGSTEPASGAVPALLLLVSDDAPVDRARLIQLAEKAADAGIYLIWVAESVSKLPAIARSFLDVRADGLSAQAGLVRLGTAINDVAIETLSREQALEFGRHLAAVVDAGAVVPDDSDLPKTVSMLSLLGADIAITPSVAVERWQQNDSLHDRSGGALRRRRPGRLRALVGHAGVDPMHLDLRTQGPHALVGGTTGSGKSEFLQAWVLGMAAEYSPDRVTFLFVDYKGGSAFAECVKLPHCVGLVTDLNPHLVQRALTSLRAELRYREHLLNRKKAKDLIELEKRGDPDSPPALVLVIDEFAALAGEVPEFVDGVVDIAQRGRSLGIHLIMATQRPAGVIRDNLRANTNLRVALRMADETDSMDVVGDKIAGTFDPSIPGRAIAKTGPGRLTSFQSAYSGGWTSDVPPPASIELADLGFGSEQSWDRPAAEEESPQDPGPTDQARLVKALIEASAELAIPAPRRPWLESLAPVFDLTRMRQRTDAELVLGARDVPEEQAQDEAFFRPDIDGNLAIFGAGGTGKTVALRSLAAAAGITPRGGPVDVYGLDFGTGGLRMLEVLPHVGSIVSGDDPERVIRLIRMLTAIRDDRSNRYSALNVSSIVGYRRAANAPNEKRILILLDNFPGFRGDFEIGAGRTQWYSAFHELLNDGRALGIHVALTADRPASVPSSIGSTIQRRVILRQADEGSYALLNVPKDVLGVDSPPGRALIDGHETQIAIVGGSSDTVEQSRALKSLAESIARTGRSPAEAVGALATEIPAGSMPSTFGDLPVLGVSDDTLAPIGFEPSGALLLAGPPASGRTSALRWLIQSVRAGVPGAELYYIGTPRSLIPSIGAWEGVARTIEESADLAMEITATLPVAKPGTRIVVVVEQIGDLLGTAADAKMVELIKAIKRSDHLLIADSETSQWNSSWPLLSEVKAARTGILLQPDGLEGENILKTALPRVSRSEFPPGRGYFISRGRAARVQLPWLDS